MRRHKRNDDYIGPSRGFARFFHKLAMFILWPLRKPLWFLLILAILFLAPTFRGVKPANVHTWYAKQIDIAYILLKDKISAQTQNVMPDISQIKLPSLPDFSKKENNKNIVDMPLKTVRRKAFEKSSDNIVKVDILNQPQDVVPNMNNVEKNELAITLPQTDTKTDKTSEPKRENTKTKKDLPLFYLEISQNISGKAIVINANELKINKQSIFLFGIYVDPNTTKGKDAAKFLKQTINEDNVECKVDAYTYQGIATGICKVRDIELNRLMVEHGYSKNVALD